jgi:hypothetical protein
MGKGWRAGLLPAPAEAIGELGLSDSQKAEITSALERNQAVAKIYARIVQFWESDNDGRKQAAREMRELGTPLGQVRDTGEVGAVVRKGIERARNTTKTAPNQVWTNEQRAILASKTPPGDTNSKPQEAVAGSETGHTIRLRVVATGKELHVFKGHAGGVSSVAFSPDGKRLASASDDRTVKLWDTASGQESLTFQGHTRGVTRTRPAAGSP